MLENTLVNGRKNANKDVVAAPFKEKMQKGSQNRRKYSAENKITFGFQKNLSFFILYLPFFEL
jgi:hypothetical protein